MKKLNYLFISTLVLIFSSVAGANLITNPTFDNDLSGWDVDASTGVTWFGGESRVGQSGTPGYAVFSQLFNISAGSTQLSVAFNHEWQINPPNITDTFSVELGYLSSTGMVFTELLSEDSNTISFNTVFSSSYLLNLADLVISPDNGIIRFRLDENNQSNGTRVHLDNVAVNEFDTSSVNVPEPSALALIGLSLLGFSLAKRKRLK